MRGNKAAPATWFTNRWWFGPVLRTVKIGSQGLSMQRSLIPVLAVCLFASTAASAQQMSMAPSRQDIPATSQMVVMAPAQPQMRPNLGGGFIEFLFGNRGPQPQVLP